MQVLDLAKIGELIVDILFGRLLMHAGDEQNVTLDGWSFGRRKRVNRR